MHPVNGLTSFAVEKHLRFRGNDRHAAGECRVNPITLAASAQNGDRLHNSR
jgi:hypothetical protein